MNTVLEATPPEAGSWQLEAGGWQPEAVPWPVYAVLFASTSVIVGVLWDISWHQTIGRDTFWTPAHLAIYLGGIVAGLTCGWLALRLTFAGTAAERAQTVRFWGFSAPFGAWVCIWGALAMITSAPFDDWWHNTYGLDVKISAHRMRFSPLASAPSRSARCSWSSPVRTAARAGRAGCSGCFSTVPA